MSGKSPPPPLIQRVLSSASGLFSDHSAQPIPASDLPDFRDRLKGLYELVSRLRDTDLGLHHSHAIHHESGSVNIDRSTRSRSPVVYVNLYEDRVITVGVFIIRPGQKIPLHNHPKMFGMLKCVHGRLDIVSYSRLPEAALQAVSAQFSAEFKRKYLHLILDGSLVPAVKQVVSGIDAAAAPSLLDAVNGNYHEVRAAKTPGGKDAPAAFLDILSPPYRELEEDEIHYNSEGTLSFP